MSKRTVLITGAAGFVGHHMVEHFLKNTTDKVIGVDSLTYAGTWDRLRDIKLDRHMGEPIDCHHIVSAYEHVRFTPIVYDFRQPAEPNLIRELKDVTHIIHMGAESHVDNSIDDPLKFTIANVLGTVNMLNLARELPNLELFCYFSTDEVFGPAPMEPEGWYNPHVSGYFDGYKESDVHDPKNPYAGSKSAAEQMVNSFANTYEIPCIITRQMNIFGERQHSEKFIPLCISAAMHGNSLKIHATPDKKQAGMRHYIHARNVADAHMFLFNEKPYLNSSVRECQSYHVVGELEVDNLTLAETINEYTGHLGELEDVVCEGIKKFEMVDFHSSRPGH